jgi:hydroxyquinol 1,2-dioxygenase
MRDFDENNITQAVLDRVAGSRSPRVKQVSEALVRHLHAFIREIEPTIEEWEAAIRFLTETGKMCSETRQEFILLSDTLGASMLVDAINHRFPAGATETTVLGPFYVADAPELPLGADIAGDMKGKPLVVEGLVRALDGKPIAGAIVDTWHSDDDGFYDVQHLEETGGLKLRGRFRTDGEGKFWFRSIVPTFYPIPYDGPVGQMLKAQGRHPFRPAHVHFMIAAPGFQKLVTHVFIAGDKYLDSDAVFGVKNSLIRELGERGPSVSSDGRTMEGSTALLAYDFALARAEDPTP